RRSGLRRQVGEVKALFRFQEEFDEDGEIQRKRIWGGDRMIGALRSVVYAVAAVGAVILLLMAVSYLMYWIGQVIG
ncbi:MAG: hypothetical protein WCX76_06065, partial [Candidatus Methanomethylophilaceae archaeon]